MKELATFDTLHNLLQQGKITCQEVVELCLHNIEEGAYLNAFLRTYAEEARQKAAELDAQWKSGQAPELAGMVVGLKDLICYQGHSVQASSKILAGFVSQFSATVTERLLAKGANIIGHQGCDEFGMGSSNENSAFGPVRNALDPERAPGGSSGGSAVAVQAGMCHVALGTDTGGSVRQPAAFCGLVGLKPTYGRISRHGLIAYASSFDTIGIFSQNIQDCATVLQTIAGPDDFDSTSARRPVPAYTQQLDFTKQAKVAYLPVTLEHPGLQEEIREQTQSTLDALHHAGHQVEAVDFPLLDYALPTYYILANAEASANLARFDGVRYGYRSPEATTVVDMYKKTRSHGFGPEVKRRILIGTFILSADYHDAWYIKAQQVRRLIKERLEEIFATYDFVVLPTTPTTPFKLGERSQDPLAMYLADLYTVIASIAGVPAISIPNGHDRQGLPIGLQVIAPAFAEAELLAFAQHIYTLS